MITATLPKASKDKITARYVEKLEAENESLLRKVIALRDTAIALRGAIKMYPKHSYEVEQADEELARVISESREVEADDGSRS